MSATMSSSAAARPPDPPDGLRDRVVEDPAACRPLALAQGADPVPSSARLTSWKYRPNDRMSASARGRSSASSSTDEPFALDRVVGLAQGDRPAPDPLDELEQLEPLLLDDDLAEQCPEEADLARQRIARTARPDAARLATDGRVGAGGHRRSLRRSRPAAPAAHLRRV